MMQYSPQNWHWIVNGDDSKAWSSSKGAYVTEYPNGKITAAYAVCQPGSAEKFLSDEDPTYIAFKKPQPTQHDYASAIQSLIDATAKAKGYADGAALAGYSESTIPAWALEAKAFIAWRDQVWVHAYTELAKVHAGQREQPTIEAILAELPPSP